MTYEIRQQFLARFGGLVDEVYRDGRRVGVVYFDRSLDYWIALTAGGVTADSREEALALVRTHAEENPRFEVQ